MAAGQPNPEVKRAEETQEAPRWAVIVLNDPVNLMSYVVVVFKRVFGMPHDTACRHMREVHELGRSCLWVGDREQVELYVHQLQGFHLSAILEKWRPRGN
jgi:ATP-dependent Clp protease adaptor protein ClpS